MFDNSKLLFRMLSGQGDGNKVFPDCSRKIQSLHMSMEDTNYKIF